MKNFRKAIFTLLFSLTVLEQIFCDEPIFEEKTNYFTNGTVFKLDPVMDGILLGTTAAFAGSMLLCGNILKINRDDYSGQTFDKETVSNIDREFMTSYKKGLDICGTILEVSMLASPLCLLSTKQNEWATLGVMYAETLMLSFGLKELGKLTVSRARPYMYYDDFPDESDWQNSFPSGHTTMAFTSATFLSYTFFKYFPESRLRFVVLGASYAGAIGTGILRMASGNHFFTDVFTGAAIGIASGLFIPWLHTLKSQIKYSSNNKVDMTLSPMGFDMKINF